MGSFASTWIALGLDFPYYDLKCKHLNLHNQGNLYLTLNIQVSLFGFFKRVVSDSSHVGGPVFKASLLSFKAYNLFKAKKPYLEYGNVTAPPPISNV